MRNEEVLYLDESLARKHATEIVSIENTNLPSSSKPLTEDMLLSGTIRGRATDGIWRHSLIAMVGATAVGFAINYEREATSWRGGVVEKIGGRCLYINIVDVAPDYQGYGIGTKLIQDSIAAFGEIGFSDGRKEPLRIVIQTNSNNDRMNHIIEKLGFKLAGTKYYNPKKTDNVYVMVVEPNTPE